MTSLSRAYSRAKELPYELREFCIFAFEEGLYSQALTLLSNVLSAPPLTYCEADSEVVFVPQPDILSLLGTLVVHPTLTTRASSAEKAAAANQALHFLRHVNKVTGPVNAKLSSALVFASRSRRVLKDRTNEDGQHGDAATLDRFGDSSLWRRAEDFWHMVGWAYNCSVHHEKRWARWKLWLELILEILDDDFRERSRLAADVKMSRDARASSVQGSLIVQYLTGPGSSHRRARRVMRAIMASGDTTSKNEFKEVFRNELRERKKQQESNRGSRKVNINGNEFGDYFDGVDALDGFDSDGAPAQNVNLFSSTEEPADARQRRSDRAQTSKALQSFNASHLSSSFDPPSQEEEEPAPKELTALDTRMRLLVLLSQVAMSIPDAFVPLEEYVELLFEFIKPLPIPTFVYFIAPSRSSFARDFHAQLNQRILGSLIFKKDRYQHSLDQDTLETFYLPSAAITGSGMDNLRVSLLLEMLVRILRDQNGLKDSGTLQQALEKGLEARHGKTSQKKSSHGERGVVPDTTESQLLVEEGLKLSAQRLRLLVRVT